MTKNDSDFADFEEGLLMIKALVLKAYYFGKEYPNCPFNPFAKVEHPISKN